TRQAYEALLSRDAEPATPAAHVSTSAPATPLVGRRSEWNQLQTLWREAGAGPPRLVLVSGEPGIGKSRLAEELQTWADRNHVLTARTRAYAAEGRLSFAPVTEWLRSRGVRPHLSRLDTASLTEVARLLPELEADHPELPRPTQLAEQWQRQRFFH